MTDAPASRSAPARSSAPEPPCARQLAAVIRSPFVPAALRALAEVPGYLVPDGDPDGDPDRDDRAPCAVLRRAADTEGFRDSARYMADMAADAAEEVYEPIVDDAAWEAAGLDAATRAALAETLDIFHWVQPQTLLLVAALAEAWERPSVGGRGEPVKRTDLPRERAHLARGVTLLPPDREPLPRIAEVLGYAEAPEVYRAVAAVDGYLDRAWDELQHLAAYPQFRRRGRALYYYARSASRFLAEPLTAQREQYRARGMPAGDIAAVDALLSTALPALATAMMHTCAMRLTLGVRTREVVRRDGA